MRLLSFLVMHTLIADSFDVPTDPHAVTFLLVFFCHAISFSLSLSPSLLCVSLSLTFSLSHPLSLYPPSAFSSPGSWRMDHDRCYWSCCQVSPRFRPVSAPAFSLHVSGLVCRSLIVAVDSPCSMLLAKRALAWCSVATVRS